MPKNTTPPAPSADHIKRITVAINYATAGGQSSKSTASSSAILAFGRVATPREATKKAILSGLCDLYTLAALEGFPEEAAEMQAKVLAGLREKGLVA